MNIHNPLLTENIVESLDVYHILLNFCFVCFLKKNKIGFDVYVMT